MAQNKSLVIVGFGSQAKAWALNFKDSQCPVKIALSSHSSSRSRAEKLGFECISLETQELRAFSTFILLIPDDQHSIFFEKNSSYFEAKSHFIYAHGFSLSKEKLHQKYPQFSHSLLAPKAIASEVRFQYETGGKIGAAFFAPNHDCEQQLRTIASQVGLTALYQSNFEEECTADLFSEQSLLCSLLPYGALKSYQVLRQNGASKEIAFMECFLELKSISQAFVTMGPVEFFKLISPNALIGSQKGRNLLLNKEFDHGLEQIMIDIKNKQFYKEVDQDANALREKVLKEWEAEELSITFDQLKSELIT